MLDRAFRVPDHVVYRAFALETVVVNLELGVYHGLNPTAGRMLELLERRSNVRDAAAALADELGQPQERSRPISRRSARIFSSVG